METILAHLEPHPFINTVITPLEHATVKRVFRRIERKPFHREGMPIVKRGLVNLNLYPSQALSVYILDTIARKSTISDTQLESLGKFVVAWEFERPKTYDEDPLYVGKRLRQRFRQYEHRYSFSLLPNGYRIDLINRP